MTSTLTAPPPLDRSLRTLTISVNLLPSEVVDARRVRKLQRLVLVALLVFVALIAVWWGVASVLTVSSRGDLERAQTESAQLIAQQRAFERLSTVQAESKSIDAELKGLFVTDLQWSDLLASLQKSLPAGVQITGITGNLAAGVPAATGPTAVPNPAGARLVGTVSVQGTARSLGAVADYLTFLASVKGTANPLLTGVNNQDGSEHFTLTADITDAALGGRFTATKGAK